MTPFAVDLTPHVRPGAPHELAVRVTNPGGWRGGEEGGALRWGRVALPGSRDVGGMWGGVALVALPHLCVADLFAMPGAAPGEAAARVVLRNTGAPATAAVRLTVLDAEGCPAGEAPVEANVTVAAGEETALTLPLRIETPRGWSPRRAYLYHVVAEVRSEHGPDRAQAPLGLRRVAEQDGCLYLNGDPLVSNLGVTTGYPGEGTSSSTPAGAGREVARALAAGLDGLVARGWPAAPELLDVADRLGLPVVQGLVGVEDPARVAAGARALYRALARDRLRRLIRRDRNHPAVVAWRLPVARQADVLAEYVQLARKEDPTRPILSARRGDPTPGSSARAFYDNDHAGGTR